MLLKIALVGAGGAIGSILRFLIALAAARLGSPFPWGTLAVNTVGCFAAAAVGGFAAAGLPLRDDVRLFVLTGLCGGFTTFSAFGLETAHLASVEQPRLAAVNVVANVIGSLLAAVAGWMVGRQFAAPAA